MAILGVSKHVTLRDLSDPDDLRRSSLNSRYNSAPLTSVQKHIRKYSVVSEQSCGRYFGDDTHTHTLTEPHSHKVSSDT